MSSDELLITDVQSALDLIMTVKYETGCTNIAVNKGAIVNDFFVLSTCLAGEILQKFISYGVRFAIYGNFSKYTSKPLRDFMFFFSGSNLSAHAAQNLSIHSMFGNGRKPVKKSLLMQRYFSP